MVGTTPLFGFVGLLLGLVFGFGWGLHRGWVVTLGASGGGAIVGLIVGCLWAMSLQWSSTTLRRSSERIAPSHKVQAEVIYWFGFAVILVVFVGPLIYLALASPRFFR